MLNWKFWVFFLPFYYLGHCCTYLNGYFLRDQVIQSDNVRNQKLLYYPVKIREVTMPLRSNQFKGDPKLEACLLKDSAHVKSGATGDHVSKIQRALLILEDPTPKIDSDEISSGSYGTTTAAAVLTYKKKRKIINLSYQTQVDNIVGKMTIAALDEEMLRKENPPQPVPPKRLDRKNAEGEIKAYLTRQMRRDVVSVLINHPSNLIVFGEIHFTFDPFKAFFLSELVRQTALKKPVNSQFHASERFPNDATTRQKISEFFRAPLLNRGKLMLQLPGPLKTFVPVLAQAAEFPNHRYAVLGIDPIGVHGEDSRHTAIFNAFVDSAARCRDVPAGSINSATSRGNMLLGARHAARRSVAGRSTLTTCARLIGAGWNVHAVRLTVPRDPNDTLIPEDLNLIVRGTSDKTPVNVLAIVEQVAAGRPFYADLTQADSPFSQLMQADKDAADIPYNQLFDAILHLAAGTVPFPTG